MEKRKKERPIITKVWAKNFRSLKDVEIELGPLTVLVGPNAAGKSNILDVLRFVAEALRMNLDAAITSRHGIRAIRRWSAKGAPYDVTVGLRIDGTESPFEYEFVLGSGPAGQYMVKREYGKLELKGLAPKPFEFEIKEGKLIEPVLEKRTGQLRLLGTPPQFEATSLGLPNIGHGILSWELPRRETKTKESYDRLIDTYRQWESLVGHLRRMRFYHMFPNVIREPQKPGNPYPLEEHGENLVSVLREMIRGGKEFLPDLRASLGRVVPGVRDVQVTPVGGFLVGKLQHAGVAGNGTGAWFDLSQESDGTLRLLGLLVALFQEPPPSLIAIEEPELTIHPGALAVLADLLQEATKRTQILITTHSPDLIDRLPVEHLRAVESDRGVTAVSMVVEHQREAIKQGLFSPGELHRREGLQPAKTRA